MEKEKIFDLIKAGVFAIKIQQIIFDMTGKTIKPKDIYNMYPFVNGKGVNSVENVLKILEQKGKMLFIRIKNFQTNNSLLF